MNFNECTKERLWQILVETAQASVMYATHKAYTRDVILKAKPDVSEEELASKLNMPIGEAMVLLQELRPENKPSV
jgi:hypothetical protein